jgi:hypothetical protein
VPVNQASNCRFFFSLISRLSFWCRRWQSLLQSY